MLFDAVPSIEACNFSDFQRERPKLQRIIALRRCITQTSDRSLSNVHILSLHTRDEFVGAEASVIQKDIHAVVDWSNAPFIALAGA